MDCGSASTTERNPRAASSKSATVQRLEDALVERPVVTLVDEERTRIEAREDMQQGGLRATRPGKRVVFQGTDEYLDSRCRSADYGLGTLKAAISAAWGDVRHISVIMLSPACGLCAGYVIRGKGRHTVVVPVIDQHLRHQGHDERNAQERARSRPGWGHDIHARLLHTGNTAAAERIADRKKDTPRANHDGVGARCGASNQPGRRTRNEKPGAYCVSECCGGEEDTRESERFGERLHRIDDEERIGGDGPRTRPSGKRGDVKRLLHASHAEADEQRPLREKEPSV